MANFSTAAVNYRNELPYEEDKIDTTIPTSTALPLTYDDYYKNSADLTTLYYYLIGVGGMCLCVFGVFGNVIAVPIFNMHNVLSSPTTYLTAISITDTITLFCGMSLLVTMRMWPKEIDQVRMYKTFTGYLVPIGQPIFECAEMCSVYLTVALLIERFQYIRHGFYVRVLCTKQTTRRVLISICVFCLLYNFPKVLEYKAVVQEVSRTLGSPLLPTNKSTAQPQVNNSATFGFTPSFAQDAWKSNSLDYEAEVDQLESTTSTLYDRSTLAVTKKEWHVRVMRTELGRNQAFIDVYGSLLRVPVEMFIPYLLLGLFCTVIATNVFESGMHQNVAASRTNLVGDTEADCTDTDHSTVIEPDSDSPLHGSAVDNDSDSAEQQNESAKCDSAGANSQMDSCQEAKRYKKRNLKNSKRWRSEQFDVAELKEQVNTVMAMYVAMLTFVCKLPQFLHTMLVSEQLRFGVAPLTLVRFGSVVHFLALANASLKFVVYVTAGRHFREAFRTLLCVTAQSICPRTCPPSRAVSASRVSSAVCSSLPTDLADATADTDIRIQPQLQSAQVNSQREEVRLNIIEEDPKSNQAVTVSSSSAAGSLSDTLMRTPPAPSSSGIANSSSRARSAASRKDAQATELTALRDNLTDANLDSKATAFGASKC